MVVVDTEIQAVVVAVVVGVEGTANLVGVENIEIQVVVGVAVVAAVVVALGTEIQAAVAAAADPMALVQQKATWRPDLPDKPVHPLGGYRSVLTHQRPSQGRRESGTGGKSRHPHLWYSGRTVNSRQGRGKSPPTGTHLHLQKTGKKC